MGKDEAVEVGKEILSYCGKCKLALAHVIISVNKKGGVDRCECKTCGNKHKYRDPDKQTKSRAKAKVTPKKAAVSSEERWNKAIADAKGIPISYEMSGEYSQGSLIDHHTFGTGIVEELIGDNKIKVIFKDGTKVLIHKRASV